jgi:formylglycine-generating enzyme required for sulfatase activity
MFMAPEQAFGYIVDHRADLFSLGSVLYNMLSGKTPFPDGTADKVLRSVTRDNPIPLKELVPETPQWLCDIITKLHAKEPADRFQTSREVVDLLENRQSPFPVAPTAVIKKNPDPVITHVPSKRWKYVAAIASLSILGLAILWFSGLFNAAKSEANSSPSAVATNGENKPLVIPNTQFTNALQMEFASVPKGKSWLGGGGGSPGEKEIDVSVDFYMGVFEVTREEWEKVMGAGKNAGEFSRTGKQAAAIRNISDADLKRFPIDGVSWNDCQQFATKVTQMTREDGWVYRLPTSLEWEYSCRGGPMASRDESRFDYYLDEPTSILPPGKANFDSSGLKRPCKVGSYPPNKLGLHDMHGNVFEYCNDMIKGKSESLRYLAGGAWIDNASICSAEHRSLGDPRSNYTGGGLRLVRVPTTGVPIAVKVVEK